MNISKQFGPVLTKRVLKKRKKRSFFANDDFQKECLNSSHSTIINELENNVNL